MAVRQGGRLYSTGIAIIPAGLNLPGIIPNVCGKRKPSSSCQNFKSWFYTEEQRYNIVVKWHKEHGIWASFVPYPGAMPVMVNSVRDDTDASPRKYQKCMLRKGYVERTTDIPEASNLFVYKPQSVNQDAPLDSTYP